jgi:hypothetical protein
MRAGIDTSALSRVDFTKGRLEGGDQERERVRRVRRQGIPALASRRRFAVRGSGALRALGLWLGFGGRV